MLIWNILQATLVRKKIGIWVREKTLQNKDTQNISGNASLKVGVLGDWGSGEGRKFFYTGMWTAFWILYVCIYYKFKNKSMKKIFKWRKSKDCHQFQREHVEIRQTTLSRCQMRAVLRLPPLLALSLGVWLGVTSQKEPSLKTGVLHVLKLWI